MAHPGRVVICGGGIIGCSIAYYLTLRGCCPILVEKTSVACGASGKAGGFLGKDFATQMKDFATSSFDLHCTLAEILTQSDFRLMDAVSLTISGKETNLHVASKQGLATSVPDWITGSIIDQPEIIGTTQNCAQVHPYKLTNSLLTAALNNGATLKIGTVEGITQLENRITGVIVDGDTLLCDQVVIAMGVWSLLAAQWLNVTIPIEPCKSQSVIFTTKDKEPIPATALFVDYLHAGGEEGKWLSPEVFPRPDNTVFIGIAEDILDTFDYQSTVVEPDNLVINQILEFSNRLSNTLKQSKSQACVFPVSSDGLPLIGKLGKTEGAYLATGHGYWGILNAPITGLAMAELILDGSVCCADISLFDPLRFQ